MTAGQGHQAENINNNNILDPWFDSRFSEEFSWRIENTHKNLLQPSVLLVFLLVSAEQVLTANFRYSEREN